MTLLTLNRIEELDQPVSDTTRISIYTECEAETAEAREKNRVRLKNHISQARQKIEGLDIPHGQREAILERAEALLNQETPERVFNGTLAIFLSPDETRLVEVPTTVADTTYVGSSYYLKPLIEALSYREQYVALAVSLNATQLYFGDRSGLRAIPKPEDMPESLEEEIKYEKATGLNQGQLYHNKTGRDNRRGTTHGENPQGRFREEARARYVRAIAHSLEKMLGAARPHLVLMGVKELTSALESELNGKVKVLEVPGNFEHADIKTLQEKTLPLVCEQAKADRKKLLETLEAARPELVARGADKCLDAARQGRVERLFLFKAERPGDTNLEPNPKEEALLDRCALETIRQSGDVVVIETRDQTTGLVQALLRY